MHRAAIEKEGAAFWNVKRVYLSYPCSYFADRPEEQFDIFNRVSTEFRVPFSSIRICGSAHTGYSFSKSRPFLLGESDLDLSIVDARLFQETLEHCYERSDGFRPDKFPRGKDNGSLRNQFLSYSGRGIIRPDLMPTGPERQKHWNFFNKLSSDYARSFKSISAAIYLSEGIFVMKQRTSLLSEELGGI